jgi:hypothetical protein
MILNESTYNPLKRIFEILENSTFTTADLDTINKELFLGGIACQNDSQRATVLDLLLAYKRAYSGN